MATLAVDLGGTKTLAALVDGPVVQARREIPTDRGSGPDDWLDEIAAAALSWRGRYSAIGMTVTGLVADGHWRPLNPETLPLPDEGYLLEHRARQVLGGPLTLCNDAQAAAWGEFVLGAGEGRDMVFVTVSTGIGAGIVLNGRLLTGRHGLAGHAGQMIAMPDGDDAPLEDTASGRWIAREAGEADARAVFAATDPACARIIETSARRVARLCRNLQLLLSPEVILIGGGVGLAPGYLDHLRAALSDVEVMRRPRLEPALLGGDAGIIGVADMARAVGR